MSEDFANIGEDPAAAPSVKRAADDLREAAGQKARAVAQSAEDRAQQLKESAAQKAQQFRDFAEEKAGQIKEVAGERAKDIKDAAGEQWQETRVKAREVHSDFEDYVRLHPSKSVLVAAGIGFLVGLIIRR